MVFFKEKFVLIKVRALFALIRPSTESMHLVQVLVQSGCFISYIRRLLRQTDSGHDTLRFNNFDYWNFYFEHHTCRKAIEKSKTSVLFLKGKTQAFTKDSQID